MNNLEMLNNYRNSLNQKYNAVCLDIDGTITKSDSKEIDDRIIKTISNLLSNKIPVVFITGRGETGLLDLVNDIYPKLLENLNFEDLKRMYALTNDGARLFFTTENSLKKLFNKKVFISTEKELEELKIFNDKIINYFNNNLLKDIFDITYSIDSVTKQILNVRLVFKVKKDTLFNFVLEEIKDIIEKFKNLEVTYGIYKKHKVIQIGTTKKDVAIEKAENIIGVPKNSMIRIGDLGDKNGDDYFMLNCQQGFSVNKINGSTNSCFPIYNKENVILKGVEATLYLLNNAKLLPTVCLEAANKEDYLYKYAQVEKEMLKGRNELLLKYNDMINRKFNTIYGINDVYDSESGSIKIPMYEWVLIDNNNPLKQLWNVKEEDKLYYSLRDNNNYLLRGSKTYYYFLSNRKSEGGKDYTSFEDVFEWYKNNYIFLTKAYTALISKYDFENIESNKMILGILDNIRNILLILLNHNLYSKYYNENLLINLNKENDKNINEIYHRLYMCDYFMTTLSFSDKNIKIEEINIFVKSIIELLKNEIEIFEEKEKNKDYSKEFRTYREIDNFAENYISVKLNVEKNKNKNKFGVCGMCYGGMELPIIYKLLDPTIEDILLLKFNKNVSGYSNKQLVDLRKFDINNYGGLLRIGDLKTNEIILMDDNILTGKTLQLAINALYDEKINVSNVNIVRYPSVNRVNQMFLQNHGAVDYNLFFNYITGLCFPSPYSWRDENENDLYLDSLGVFDLNRKKIIECIIKNHDYKEHSEISEYKRRLMK